MTLVEPDVIFRRLAQIIGISPIVYHGIMVVVASRIIGGPPDDGEVVVGNFERWPLEDLDVRGFRRRRRILSDDRMGEEHAAGRRGDCQRDEFIHAKNPQSAPPDRMSSSFPRKQEPRANDEECPWTPASAGVTIKRFDLMEA
jgi:hypothetical protein